MREKVGQMEDCGKADGSDDIPEMSRREGSGLFGQTV